MKLSLPVRVVVRFPLWHPSICCHPEVKNIFCNQQKEQAVWRTLYGSNLFFIEGSCSGSRQCSLCHYMFAVVYFVGHVVVIHIGQQGVSNLRIKADSFLRQSQKRN